MSYQDRLELPRPTIDYLSLKFWLRGVLHTAELNFSNFVIDYLGEIDTQFENTLACLSGAQRGSNQEKNWRSKISRHTPFKLEAVKTRIEVWTSVLIMVLPGVMLESSILV